MLAFIKCLRSKYYNSNRKEKGVLIEEVLKYVHSKGGRFLKQSGNPADPDWYILSTFDAYTKVCQCLRGGKHRKPQASSSLNTEPGPAPVPANGLFKSIDTLHDQLKQARNTTRDEVAPSVDSASSDEAEDQDDMTVNDHQEESHGTVGTESTSQKDLRAKACTAVTLNREERSVVNLQGYLPNRVPPQKKMDTPETSSTRPSRTSVPLVGVNTLSQHQRIHVPENAWTQLMSLLQQQLPYGTHQQHLSLTGVRPSLDNPSNNEMSQPKVADKDSGIMVGIPRSSDILFGTDPSFYYHPGNVQVRQLIEDSVGYLPMSPENIAELSCQIVSKSIQRGARFFTRQASTPKGVWYRIDEKDAQLLIVRCVDAESSKKAARLLLDRRNVMDALRLQRFDS